MYNGNPPTRRSVKRISERPEEESSSMQCSLQTHNHSFDVCVVGGGMAGLIAAVAAARRGARTALIHERPVLGGNASSEVRMWICGAHGKQRKEAGILEEIQLANLRRNPEGLYAVWDSVLWQFATQTPGLTTFLNTTVNDAWMDGDRLAGVQAWQLTSQTWHRVEARLFIDASGDSILAPLSGAEVRHGREAREEFGESIAPTRSDLKTMGNTILLQLEETTRPQPYEPPIWAYRFDDSTNLPSRVGSGLGHNFWWLELGGLKNTIDDAEQIRDELVKTAWGVWNYMKNHGPQAEKLTNWRLRWMGALPGKRENRRYLGDYILSQNDIEAEGHFDDIVAYGGWSMDDHHPAGFYYPGGATIFHRAPSPYGIPLRALYSRNVPNLFCAGRNISATHAALSSTRVMATCSIIGQAVGTAAALCLAEGCRPSDLLKPKRLSRLQSQLMDDDCWLPGKQRAVSLASEASFRVSGDTAMAERLLSGEERETDDTLHHWEGDLGETLVLEWTRARKNPHLRLVFDSDFNDAKKMPCLYPEGGPGMAMPADLVKAFRVEIRRQPDHDWEIAYEVSDNCRRLVVLPLPGAVSAIRWTGLATWGAPRARLFSLDLCQPDLPASLNPDPGKHWNEVVAEIKPEDLRDPEHSEAKGKAQSRFGA